MIDRIHNDDGTQLAVPGGGPFNTARALARLGVPTAFLGRTSDDVFGRQMASLLISDGASLELTSIGPEPTTIAIADVDTEGIAEYQFFVVVMRDPNIRVGFIPDSEYRERLQTVISHSAIVKASEGDLAWLFPDRDSEQLAERLFSAGVILVVITLGAQRALGGHRETARRWPLHELTQLTSNHPDLRHFAPAQAAPARQVLEPQA